ncbi:hypothetical protein N657DRAFT_234849 [Parathielavia appendiculata]|uniref:Uncharacterized protein n=1 Tax=Parathielavia appendiculata TaxID=2587402 RepID=A0AAN6UAB1_9PEZI|nr:hypothetical protein N657DRAFT_234849 [Parathielavia appendiculata]
MTGQLRPFCPRPSEAASGQSQFERAQPAAISATLRRGAFSSTGKPLQAGYQVVNQNRISNAFRATRGEISSPRFVFLRVHKALRVMDTLTVEHISAKDPHCLRAWVASWRAGPSPTNERDGDRPYFTRPSTATISEVRSCQWRDRQIFPWKRTDSVQSMATIRTWPWMIDGCQ